MFIQITKRKRRKNRKGSQQFGEKEEISANKFTFGGL
jgi:hypothetical protein